MLIKGSGYKIYGHVSKSFEPVLERFNHNFKTGIDKQSQLCVYHGNKKVIDIYGRQDSTENYNADSVTSIYSSGKMIGSIMMAI